mgnify:CR=1 FL=1
MANLRKKCMQWTAVDVLTNTAFNIPQKIENMAQARMSGGANYDVKYYSSDIIATRLVCCFVYSK